MSLPKKITLPHFYSMTTSMPIHLVPQIISFILLPDFECKSRMIISIRQLFRVTLYEMVFRMYKIDVFINNTKHIISFLGKECLIEILSINHLLFYSSHLCFSDKKTACQGIGDKYTNTTGDNFKIKYYINNEHKEAIYDGIACSIATATWVG